MSRRRAVALAALALLAVAVAVGSSRSRPSIDAQPVAAGRFVSVSGSGFPRWTPGRILVAGSVTGRFVTDGDGRFRTSVVASSGARVSAVTTTARTTSTVERDSNRADTASVHPVDASIDPHADALERRARGELRLFVDWLVRNGSDGYIGELGWPSSDVRGVADYNQLAERYLADMDAAGLPGAMWATGEWWGDSYPLSAYVERKGSAALDLARPSAAVLERHAEVLAIQDNGGEFGAPSGLTATSRFSNESPGTYDVDWHYDGARSFAFLAKRGVREIVLPFRWERIQPILGGDLNREELARIEATIKRAAAAGVTTIPVVANYGAYWLRDASSGGGVRYPIGSDQVPIDRFADLWRRLSSALRSQPGVVAYGLMREPAGLPGSTTREQAELWERASQAAVDAIRATGDGRRILVSGYRFANLHVWSYQHPRAWITDPAANFAYEAHHYWDIAHVGEYVSYQREVSAAKVSAIAELFRLDLP